MHCHRAAPGRPERSVVGGGVIRPNQKDQAQLLLVKLSGTQALCRQTLHHNLGDEWGRDPITHLLDEETSLWW